MASFGENLRREREMRGVNLEEISASTRIGVRFLEALEADNFSAMPGGIFTRSFIRAYAAYLGLDQEAVLAEFQTLAPPEDKLDLNRLGASKASPGAAEGRSPALLWLLAAALLAGGWGLYRYGRRTPDSQATAGVAPLAGAPAVRAAPAAAQSTAGAALPANVSLGPASSNSQANQPAGSGSPPTATKPTATPAMNPPASTTSTAPTALTPAGALGGGDLVLQVAATERVWVALSADGKKVFQKTLNPNEVETFRATDSFDVTTGNAQGTILTLNGETQKPLGRRGELKRIHLTRQDFQAH